MAERVNSERSVLFRGEPIGLYGSEVCPGDLAPDCRLVDAHLEVVHLAEFRGKTILCSVVPSLDTSTCHAQTKRFHEAALSLDPTVVVLSISLDLPFAIGRWCEAEVSERLKGLSDHRFREFGERFGTFIPALGLLTRAVFVISPDFTLSHVEYTSNLSAEPDYSAALKAIGTSSGSTR